MVQIDFSALLETADGWPAKIVPELSETCGTTQIHTAILIGATRNAFIGPFHVDGDGECLRYPHLSLRNPVAPFDAQAPAWTQDGRKAELFAISTVALQYPYTFRVRDKDGRLKPVAYRLDGKSRRSPHPDDLTNTRPH